MTEELDPMSLSTQAVRDRDVVEAYERARTLEDLDVQDVDGVRVGRITRCFADVGAGEITTCEIRLDKDAKRMFDANGDTVRVRHDWITNVAAEGARLDHSARELIHGEAAARESEGGSATFPRKER